MAILEVGMSLEMRIDKAEKRILESLSESQVSNQFHIQLKDKIQQMEKSVNQVNEQQTKMESAMKEQKEAVQDVLSYTEELKNSVHEIKRLVVSQDKENRE